MVIHGFAGHKMGVPQIEGPHPGQTVRNRGFGGFSVHFETGPNDQASS